MLVIYESAGNTEKEANRAKGGEGETVHESTAETEPQRISFSGSGSGKGCLKGKNKG